MSIPTISQFLNESASPYHAVLQAIKILTENGFQHVRETQRLVIDKPCVYSRDSSSFIAYIPGTDFTSGFAAVASHTDSPTLRLTQAGELKQFGSIFSIPCEPYSGPVIQRWIDRPLQLAGRIFYLQNQQIKIKHVRKSGFFIPGLAPHMLRGTDQKDWYPQDTDFIVCCEESDQMKDKMTVHSYVKSIAGLESDAELTSIQLEFSCAEIKESDKLIHAARLDNLASVYSSIVGLIDSLKHSPQTPQTRVVFAFNNEEVGSNTRAGAAGPVIVNWWKRICCKLDDNDLFAGLAKSVVASVDGAHAKHPIKGAQSCHDPVPVLGSGVTLKVSQKQNYAFTDHILTVVEAICRKNAISHTQWIQKSNKQGGGTIGSIIATHDDVNTFDCGITMLSMHSCIETADKRDIDTLSVFCKAVFEQAVQQYSEMLTIVEE